jgi:hypothetical protein
MNRFRPLAWLLAASVFAAIIPVHAQRPTTPVTPGGGGGTPPVVTPPDGQTPGNNNRPGGGGIVTPPVSGATVPVSAPAAMLANETALARVMAQENATYQWEIIDGETAGAKFVGASTAAAVRFTATAAGSFTLIAAVTVNGATARGAVSVRSVDGAAAGKLTIPDTATVGATGLTASVPAADGHIYTWTLTGGGNITGGQRTNSITFAVGPQAGPRQIACSVAFSGVTVLLRSVLVVLGSGAQTNVAVTNGSGGGRFPAGSRIDVWADPPPAGQVFDRWTGDTTGLATPTAAHTVLTVPATAATITATYRAATAWSPVAITGFNAVAGGSPGVGLTYFIPANPVGLIVLLHDTGATASSWFTSVEGLTFARDAVATGFGVAALDSTNRAAGTWSAAAELSRNPDAANLVAALDRFIGAKLITAATPVFLVGEGDGGDMATRVADLLANAPAPRPVRGVVLYGATAPVATSITTGVPHFFAYAQNDEQLSAADFTRSQQSVDLLVGRGIAAGLMTNTISPVYAGRFRALGLVAPNFTAADSQVVVQALKNAGLLDANNYLRLEATTTEAAIQRAIPAAYAGVAPQILAQMAVCAATHEFFSDADSRVLAFFRNRATADTAGPTPARAVNLSVRAQVGVDPLFAGFVISGNAPKTVLVRAAGPALALLGVEGFLPFPRIELRRDDTLVRANDGWDAVPAAASAQLATAAANIGAFPFPPGSPDAAILATLEPGAYTALVTADRFTAGITLVEVYEVSRTGSRLVNLSARSYADTGANVLIAGMVVDGNSPRTLLVRAVGPGLTPLGVGDVLADPRQVIRDADGRIIAQNNDWSAGGNGPLLAAAAETVGAFPLTNGSKDAAQLIALAPGDYTIEVSGVNGTTGNALVEVYEVP